VIMKILLAIDGSQCSNAAIREVAESRWPSGSAVKVLSVIEPLVVPVPEAVVMPESCYEVMEMEAHAEVDRGIKAIKKITPDVKVESKVRLGKAEEVILEEAESWGADLIVVGSHGRGRTGRLLLGSVSQAVALHAKCSVEIVRSVNSNSANGIRRVHSQPAAIQA
jgi:nucleotide-binding universal stress UspA family protein